jgi:hypothetical protein
MTPAAEPPAWTLSVDPLTFAIGIAHVQVERAIGPRASVYAGPSLRLFDGILAGINGPWTAVGAEVGVRGFFIGKAPEGGWIMLRGVLAAASANADPGDLNAAGYTSGLVGYTAILGPGLVLAGGLGVSWFSYGAGGYGVFGFAPAAHTNIGWAF